MSLHRHLTPREHDERRLLQESFPDFSIVRPETPVNTAIANTGGGVWATLEGSSKAAPWCNAGANMNLNVLLEFARTRARAFQRSV